MKSTPVQLTVPNNLLNQIDEIARREYRSRSNVIIVLLQLAIAKKENEKDKNFE